MKRSNVFLVSGRHAVSGSKEFVQCIVCATDRAGVLEQLQREFKTFETLGMISLADLEDTAQRMRHSLAGHDGGWQVIWPPTGIF